VERCRRRAGQAESLLCRSTVSWSLANGATPGTIRICASLATVAFRDANAFWRALGALICPGSPRPRFDEELPQPGVVFPCPRRDPRAGPSVTLNLRSLAGFLSDPLGDARRKGASGFRSWPRRAPRRDLERPAHRPLRQIRGEDPLVGVHHLPTAVGRIHPAVPSLQGSGRSRLPCVYRLRAANVVGIMPPTRPSVGQVCRRLTRWVYHEAVSCMVDTGSGLLGTVHAIIGIVRNRPFGPIVLNLSRRYHPPEGGELLPGRMKQGPTCACFHRHRAGARAKQRDRTCCTTISSKRNTLPELRSRHDVPQVRLKPTIRSS